MALHEIQSTAWLNNSVFFASTFPFYFLIGYSLSLSLVPSFFQIILFSFSTEETIQLSLTLFSKLIITAINRNVSSNDDDGTHSLYTDAHWKKTIEKEYKLFRKTSEMWVYLLFLFRFNGINALTKPFFEPNKSIVQIRLHNFDVCINLFTRDQRLDRERAERGIRECECECSSIRLRSRKQYMRTKANVWPHSYRSK